MAGRFLLILPMAALAVGLVLLVVRLAHAVELSRLEASARRRAVATSVVCFVAVGLFASLSPIPAADGVRLATLPAVAGLVGVLVAGTGERLWPVPTGPRREASLGSRRDLGGHGLAWRAGSGLVASGALLLLGVLTAAPDGRSVARTWEQGSASAGPYPGVDYALPIVLALLALVAGTWWALRRVDARPALPAGEVELDRTVRLASRIRVLRFTASAALLTAAGLAMTMGASLNSLAQTVRLNLPSAPQAPWDWVQNGGFALILLALVAVVLGFQSLLWPSPVIRGAAGGHQPQQQPQPESEPADGVR